MIIDKFLEQLDARSRTAFEQINSPVAIQEFLDTTVYPDESFNRSPKRVLQDRRAHCLDGALFAAAALRRLGFPPRLVDMFPEPGRDDDHVLAIFQQNGGYGAVAKSNFVGLRYREPVYRTLRELVMSYFEPFFNSLGERTMRTYTRPFNLAKLDSYSWMWSDAGADEVEKRLLSLPRLPLITLEMAEGLSKVDPLSIRAGMLVVNEAGLYKPGQSKVI